MMKMTRKQIKIKKIDNLPARQVTFSKRRRGLFKKAQEQSVLTDSEVAVIVFSATSCRLSGYSSSSTKNATASFNSYSNDVEQLDQSSLELQLETDNYIKLRKKLTDQSRQLRQIKGDDLEELEKLEKDAKAALGRVIETKGAELIETNNQLRRRVSNYHEHMVMLSKGNGPVVAMES